LPFFLMPPAFIISRERKIWMRFSRNYKGND
jgi:hypothetical protein